MNGKIPSHKIRRNRTLTLLSLILAGETIFFLPFVLARVFRPTLLITFEITNTELGSYFSVYGIVAMISYIFGGPLADRFSSRNLISIALGLTALGGFVMSTIPHGRVMFVIYAFWGMTTILLFWAALIKATRQWGGANFQGRAFGWLEGGRGLTAALLGTLSLWLFSSIIYEESTQVLSQQRIQAFRSVILTTSLFTLVCGVIVWFFVPHEPSENNSHKINFSQVLHLAKKPSIWILAVIILCAYTGYKITDDFSLFAKEVLGFNEVGAAGVGTAALWTRALVAIIAGFLADRFNVSKIIVICFTLSTIGGMLMGTGIINQLVVGALLNLSMILVGIYGVRALYFALIQESRIPFNYTGTAVGLVSIIGFMPDIYMSPWMGFLLDNSPGTIGHKHVFIVLSLFSLIGLAASISFIWHAKRRFIMKNTV